MTLFDFIPLRRLEEAAVLIAQGHPCEIIEIGGERIYCFPDTAAVAGTLYRVRRFGMSAPRHFIEAVQAMPAGGQ
jgi:hypothetical protein